MVEHSHAVGLLFVAAAAVIALIWLISSCKLHAFLALALASLLMGIGAGMPWQRVALEFENGFGAVLSSIGMVIGLGAVLGKLLAESGAANRIAEAAAARAGPKRLDWAVAAAAFFIGLPVFFAVGLVLLIPIWAGLRQTRRSMSLRLGVALLAGLSVAHGFVPPHPGPLAAIALLHADLGMTLLLSLALGAPVAILAGPVLGRVLEKYVAWNSELKINPRRGARAPLAVSIAILLLPIALMLSGTAAKLAGIGANWAQMALGFLGDPLVALLVAALAALYFLGVRLGANRRELLRLTEESLTPAASIFLVVGAGGGFSRVLIASGIGDAFAHWTEGLRISPLILGWLLAGGVRVATGSATVAITTAAGLMAPVAQALPPLQRSLLVLSMGAGSLILSHVNDGGFWLVREYFGLTVAETLRTWTVQETVIGTLGLLGALALSVALR